MASYSAASPERQIESTFHENTQAVMGGEEGVNFSRIKDILAKCTEKCFAPAR